MLISYKTKGMSNGGIVVPKLYYCDLMLSFNVSYLRIKFSLRIPSCLCYPLFYLLLLFPDTSETLNVEIVYKFCQVEHRIKFSSIFEYHFRTNEVKVNGLRYIYLKWFFYISYDFTFILYWISLVRS